MVELLLIIVSRTYGRILFVQEHLVGSVNLSGPLSNACNAPGLRGIKYESVEQTRKIQCFTYLERSKT